MNIDDNHFHLCDRSCQLWGWRSRWTEFSGGPVPPGQRRRFWSGHWPHHERNQRPDLPGEHTVGHRTAGGWKYGHPGNRGGYWVQEYASQTVTVEECECEVLMSSNAHTSGLQLNGTTKSAPFREAWVESQQGDVISAVRSCVGRNLSYCPGTPLCQLKKIKWPTMASEGERGDNQLSAWWSVGILKSRLKTVSILTCLNLLTFEM